MLRQLLARVPHGVRTGMGRGPAVMDRSPAEVPRKAAKKGSHYLCFVLTTNSMLFWAILDSSEAASSLQTLHHCLPSGFLLLLFCNHLENSELCFFLVQ